MRLSTCLNCSIVTPLGGGFGSLFGLIGVRGLFGLFYFMVNDFYSHGLSGIGLLGSSPVSVVIFVSCFLKIFLSKVISSFMSWITGSFSLAYFLKLLSLAMTFFTSPAICSCISDFVAESSLNLTIGSPYVFEALRRSIKRCI